MINESKMWDMIGFSFYSFEGIGTIMPIMKESKHPESFPKLLKLALGALAAYFTLFGLVSYYYFGTQD